MMKDTNDGMENTMIRILLTLSLAHFLTTDAERVITWEGKERETHTSFVSTESISCCFHFSGKNERYIHTYIHYTNYVSDLIYK